jgi:voltage-gated sodium channel
MTLRQSIDHWLDQPFVRNGIIAVIVLNAVVLGLDTSDQVMDRVGG